MKVAFIGAGKVGTSLGCYMYGKGVEIAGYYSRSMESSVKASILTNSRAYEDIELLSKEPLLIFITTPDSYISSIVENLLNIQCEWRQKIVCHMSGAYSSDILSLLNEKGATVCSLHPMMSFNDLDSSVEALHNACFTLDGYGEELNYIKDFIKGLGNKCFEINPQSKGLYHTAACMVSNYMVTLLDIGMEMFKTCGFDQENLKELIRPLVQKVVDNIFDTDTKNSLTGPISRGDVSTVRKHLTALKEINENWLEVYKVLAAQTAELALRANRIEESVEKEIKGVLKNHG